VNVNRREIQVGDKEKIKKSVYTKIKILYTPEEWPITVVQTDQDGLFDITSKTLTTL